jgi:hypothetical protein
MTKTEARICGEAEAVELILGLVQKYSTQWIASERRLECETLMALVSETVRIDEAIAQRAKQLASIGYGANDALHLASAESAAAGDGNPRVLVRNPVFWLKEQRS